MTKQKKWTRGAVGALAMLMAAVVLGGCQGGASRVEFQRELSAGAKALQAGDLGVAELHIAKAGRKAESYEQKRQVQSLASLSAGARAMMAGDAGEAKRQWAAIRDPRLNRQVRLQAESVMGLEVPMTVQAEDKQ